MYKVSITPHHSLVNQIHFVSSLINVWQINSGHSYRFNLGNWARWSFLFNLFVWPNHSDHFICNRWSKLWKPKVFWKPRHFPCLTQFPWDISAAEWYKFISFEVCLICIWSTFHHGRLTSEDAPTSNIQLNSVFKYAQFHCHRPKIYCSNI